MMNLLSIENLIVFDLNGGTPHLFTSDSPEKEFSLTLQQQLENQEGVPIEEGDEEAALSSHHQELLPPFTPPPPKESSSSEGFDPLFQLIHLTSLHRLKTPIPEETGVVEPTTQPPSEYGGISKAPTFFFMEGGKWNHPLGQLNEYPAATEGISGRVLASEPYSLSSFTPFQTDESLEFRADHFRDVQTLMKEDLSFMPLPVGTPENTVTNATGSYMGQPFDLIHQKPLPSQSLKGGFGRSSSMPEEAEETTFDLSMIKRLLPESSQRELNRASLRAEEISSPFDMKRDDKGVLLGTSRVEKTEQGLSFFSDSNPVSINRSSSDQPFPFELKELTIVRQSHPHAEPEGEEAISSKNLSQKEGISQGVHPQGQNDPAPLRGEVKAQPIDVSRAEFFERVGRAITWSVRKGEERIAMRLEPPELGTLFIKLERKNEALKATLWAEHQATKELLELHRQDLRRILEADGFKLERFEVYMEQQADRFLEERSFSFLERRQGRGPIEEDAALRTPDPLETHSIVERRHLGEGHYIDRIV